MTTTPPPSTSPTNASLLVPWNQFSKEKKIRKACGLCIRAKVACDFGRPCTRCRERGIAASCEDVERKQRSNGNPENHSSKRKRNESPVTTPSTPGSLTDWYIEANEMLMKASGSTSKSPKPLKSSKTSRSIPSTPDSQPSPATQSDNNNNSNIVPSSPQHILSDNLVLPSPLPSPLPSLHHSSDSAFFFSSSPQSTTARSSSPHHFTNSTNTYFSSPPTPQSSSSSSHFTNSARSTSPITNPSSPPFTNNLPATHSSQITLPPLTDSLGKIFTRFASNNPKTISFTTDPTCVFSKSDFSVVDCNDTFAQVVGYESARELLSITPRRTYLDLSYPDILPHVQKALTYFISCDYTKVERFAMFKSNTSNAPQLAAIKIIFGHGTFVVTVTEIFVDAPSCFFAPWIKSFIPSYEMPECKREHCQCKILHPWDSSSR